MQSRAKTRCMLVVAAVFMCMSLVDGLCFEENGQQEVQKARPHERDIAVLIETLRKRPWPNETKEAWIAKRQADRRAAEELVALGNLAVPSLADLLFENVGRGSELAAKALRKIGGVQVVEVLTKAWEQGVLSTWSFIHDLGRVGGSEEAQAAAAKALINGLQKDLFLTENDNDLEWALMSLRDIGGVQAVEGLTIALLKHGWPDRYRAQAASYLGGIRGDEAAKAAAVKGLTQALSQQGVGAEARRATISALVQIGGVQAVGALGKTLLQGDGDVPFRKAAAMALGEIGGVAAVQNLKTALMQKGGDVTVREAAAWALAEIGGVQHVGKWRAWQAARQAGHDGDEFVPWHWGAHYFWDRSVLHPGFAQQVPTSALAKTVGDEAVRVLSRALLQHDGAKEVRRAAAWALDAIGGVAAVQSLTTALWQDDDSSVLLAATTALKEALRGRGRAPTWTHESDAAREAAASPDAVQGLMQALFQTRVRRVDPPGRLVGHGSVLVRREAARALAEIGGERAVEGLPQALRQDLDYYVCWEGITALVRVGGDQAVQELTGALLRRGGHVDCRRAAAWALAETAGVRIDPDGPPTPDGELRVIDDEPRFHMPGRYRESPSRWDDWGVGKVHFASRGATRVGGGGDPAVWGLTQALLRQGDDDMRVRRAAAWALRAIGGAQALHGLTDARGHIQDRSILKAAYTAELEAADIGSREAMRN